MWQERVEFYSISNGVFELYIFGTLAKKLKYPLHVLREPTSERERDGEGGREFVCWFMAIFRV